MNLSEEQLGKVISLVNEKYTNKAHCPLCNHSKLNLNSKFFELREFNNGDIILDDGQSIFPVLPITCPECGYTIFINPAITGILK